MTSQLLLSLSILIVVHEWGHFITARMFKIKVEKFYLFFDFLFPLANVLNFSLLKFKKGDTEYGIGWFPLGGYVKIAGMVDESMDKEQMNAPAQPWEFRTKPAWQRLIVMLGGIIVNVIVGVIIFIGLTWALGDTYLPNAYVNEHGGIHSLEFGKELGFETGDLIVKINGRNFKDFNDVNDPDVLLSKGSYYTVLRNGQEVTIPIPGNFIEHFNNKEAADKFIKPRYPARIFAITKEVEGVNETMETSIAQRIGLQAGDVFIEFDGKPVTFYDDIPGALKAHKDADGKPLGDSISFKVQRGTEVLSFREPYTAAQIGFAVDPGIQKEDLSRVTYSFGESVATGTERAFGVIFVQLKAFKKIFSGEISLKKSLSGPIGMANAFGPEWDWERFWRMTGLLSMVLAFMNLLPIPALDGGYVVFLLYEMASGRQPSEKFFEAALKVGMFLLLILMVFVFYNDIAKLISPGN
ncbi:MAG TPA: RIP metalloprotease RseP [Cyclobacteriaceae bacterium]|nr:RIP metalloprotease RseP [Cyclobacteriaceae bacterium]